MEYVARLFPEARERQRHRRRRAGAVVAAVALLAAAVATAVDATGVFRSGAGPVPGIYEPPGTLAVSPSALFSQAPYMGVHCPIANSIACDQVGLAIWLKHPAYAVTATINGRWLAMNRFGDEPISANRSRTEFDGYLQPAGIVTSLHVRPVPGTRTWLGDGSAWATVWLLVDEGGGRHVVTHLPVNLEAGWG